MIHSLDQFTLYPTSSEPVPNIKYGYLYNWYVASDALFAPVGWHVPTQAEFETLSTTLGFATAGGQLKELGTDYWLTPNTGATNGVSFNGRGSGIRTTAFALFNERGALWSTTDLSGQGYVAYMSYEDSYLSPTNPSFRTYYMYGLNVRLIKDTSDWTEGDIITDLDSNVYRTTKIGDQVWLADNWACTKLNDETPIPNVTDDTEWSELITGALCAYDNDEDNVFI